jgi:hypothetical protein
MKVLRTLAVVLALLVLLAAEAILAEALSLPNACPLIYRYTALSEVIKIG